VHDAYGRISMIALIWKWRSAMWRPGQVDTKINVGERIENANVDEGTYSQDASDIQLKDTLVK
jgi:hypothetical protein